MNERKEYGSSEDMRPHQNELVNLTELAGIDMNPAITRTLIQMLNMNIPPEVIYQLLKQIKRSGKTVKGRKTTSD